MGQNINIPKIYEKKKIILSLCIYNIDWLPKVYEKKN